MAEIDVATLRQLLRCEPETGKLYWLQRPIGMFADAGGRYTAERNAAIWNTKNAGKEAMTALSHGYRHGRIFRKGYFAHRVIWAFVHGEWPTMTIDHIDGNPLNNSIVNLREVSQKENGKNVKIPSHNTSGVMGVHWDSARGQWAAKIMVNQKTINLRRHDNFEAAVAARKDAEAKYGFHENHGRAA